MYNGGDGTITVCDLNSICSADNNSVFGPFSFRFPLISRDLTNPDPALIGKFNGWRTDKYIDLFASGLIHENKHRQIDYSWRSGYSLTQLSAMDGDWDGIQCDEEWLAYEQMGSYTPGTFDHLDWAYPGKNWPKE